MRKSGHREHRRLRHFHLSSFARQNTINGGACGACGGKYQDNPTLNCTTPFTAGTDADGNN